MKKIVFKSIIFLLTLFISNVYANEINITTMVNERNNNITLTKSWYNYTTNYIKRNFYWNSKSLSYIKQDIDKLNFRKDTKYITYWILKTESNFIPIWWLKAKQYFKSNWGRVWNKYVQCTNNPKLPIYVKKYWRNVSLSVYKNYHNKRRWWFSQFIAFCELRSYLKTKEETEFLDNSKTSYAGAIWVFQFLPLNIVKKFHITDKELKNKAIFNLSFYMKYIHKFLWLQDMKYIFKSSQDLKKCNNYYSRRFPECKNLRERIFWYNKSTRYINKVINNSANIWKMDESWLFSSPVDDIYINKSKNLQIKINDPITTITQYYNLSYKRRHPAIDIAPILYWINSKSANLEFYKKNNVEVIWNSNKTVNCYFLPYDKNNNFLKYLWNSIICQTIDWKYLSLYSHLKSFNKDILSNGIDYKQNHSIIAWWLNWFSNAPWIITPLNNYKFKKIIKVKNIKPWQTLWYIWNTWNTTWPHLHYSYAKIDYNTHKINVLPLHLFSYLNNIKLFDKEY